MLSDKQILDIMHSLKKEMTVAEQHAFILALRYTTGKVEEWIGTIAEYTGVDSGCLIEDFENKLTNG